MCLGVGVCDIEPPFLLATLLAECRECFEYIWNELATRERYFFAFFAF